MKKYKKVLSLILVAVLAVSIATACSKPSVEEVEQKGDVVEISYPEKPIQIISPSAPGGDLDVSARLLAKNLEKYLGQPAVVVNLPGGGSNIANHHVYDAKADGYTILLTHTTMFIANMTGTSELGFDDFKPVSIIANSDTAGIWLVDSNSEIKTLTDLAKIITIKPGTVRFMVSAGAPTQLHLLAFEKATGGKFKRVDGGTGVDRVAGFLSGQTDVLSMGYKVVKDYIEKGEMVPLGNITAADKESKFAPGIPSFKEQGFDVEGFPVFFATLVHKDTPDEIVEKLSWAIGKTMTDPDVIEEFENADFTLNYMDCDEASSYIKEQAKYYEQFRSIMAENLF